MGDPSKAPNPFPSSGGGEPPHPTGPNRNQRTAVIALAALAAVLLGGVIVLLVSGGSDPASKVRTSVSVSTKTATAPALTVERTTVVTNSSPAPAPAAAAGDDWSGGSGYTTVIDSVETRAEAEQIQSQAQARGIQSGILWSTNHSSLRPNWWVVYAGDYSTQPEAAANSASVRTNGFPGAYTRFVSN